MHLHILFVFTCYFTFRHKYFSVCEVWVWFLYTHFQILHFGYIPAPCIYHLRYTTTLYIDIDIRIKNPWVWMRPAACAAVLCPRDWFQFWGAYGGGGWGALGGREVGYYMMPPEQMGDSWGGGIAQNVLSLVGIGDKACAIYSWFCTNVGYFFHI